MSDIAVSKIVKTTTDDKDSYEVTMKGQMRFDAEDPKDPKDVYSEIADIELKIKGINQQQLLEGNHLFWIKAVKSLDLRDVQTQLSGFEAPGNTYLREHIIDQELWIDSFGDIRTQDEIRAIFLDLEEQGLMAKEFLESTTFLEYLESQTSVDEIYEENPEMIQAIRLHKHGYDFWGPRMQVYSGEIDEAEDRIFPFPERVIP